jgi:DNA-binding MarR family transcriptional regulator
VYLIRNAANRGRALNQVTLSSASAASDRKRASDDVAVDSLAAFLSMPGYLIRRSKQTSTLIFTETCKDFGITPIQFAAMAILRFRPGIDQTELGEIAALDPSTAGDVIQRLERRKLLQRQEQGQRRICDLTADGLALLEKVSPLVAAAQGLILEALTSREQTQLLRLMSKMNGVSNLHHATPKMRRRRRRLVSKG